MSQEKKKQTNNRKIEKYNKREMEKLINSCRQDLLFNQTRLSALRKTKEIKKYATRRSYRRRDIVKTRKVNSHSAVYQDILENIVCCNLGSDSDPSSSCS